MLCVGKAAGSMHLKILQDFTKNSLKLNLLLIFKLEDISLELKTFQHFNIKLKNIDLEKFD